MDHGYLVEPLKQPNESSCIYTALSMVDRWRRAHIGRGWTTDPELDAVVQQGPTSAAKVTNFVESTDLPKLCEAHRFKMRPVLDTTPQAFDAVLAEGAPFVYIARLDVKYSHAIVITGLRARAGGISEISFIDPYIGQSSRSEFYGFLTNHPPTGNAAFCVVPIVP
jgi:Papain-like cysteine protease AvrRpt2